MRGEQDDRLLLPAALQPVILPLPTEDIPARECLLLSYRLVSSWKILCHLMLWKEGVELHTRSAAKVLRFTGVAAPIQEVGGLAVIVAPRGARQAV